MEQTAMGYLDDAYSEAEFGKGLMHHDVVSRYQKKLERELGHAVAYADAEYVAYGWFGTDEERTEKLRQKYSPE